MRYIRLHTLQSLWVFFCGGLIWTISRCIFTSYWISVPVFVISWIIFAWTGIAILGLLDPDVRLASKLGLKVENLPIYRKAFDDLVEKEKRGENTEWIGNKLPDQREWLIFLQYVIKEEAKII